MAPLLDSYLVQTRLHEVVDDFAQLHLLVVGDVILDRYWWGEASRLSPEAPVPVLLKRKTTVRPGGAANAAANVSALGARVDLMGVVGQDHEAEELREALRLENIGFGALVSTPNRPTTTKTRLIAGQQQIVRLDEEETAPIGPELAAEFVRALREYMTTVNGILVSDYAKGLLTPGLLEMLIGVARESGKPVFIDPKGLDFKRYRGATCLKPNRLELGLLTGRTIRNHHETLEAGRLLRDQLGGASLLVTEAADGMTYFGAGGEEHHTASQTRQVFDITGAGDTVLAAFSLAFAAGATVPEAMQLASLAAGITIATLGAATVSPAQLKAAIPAT